MASIGKAFATELVAYLLADAALAALIGNRLWATRAAQHSETPYVVWQTIYGTEEYAHDGATGLEERRVQFNIFADTVSETESVRDAIKDRIAGFVGALGATVRVGHCFFDNDVDLDAGTSADLRQKTIDFRFMASAL